MANVNPGTNIPGTNIPVPQKPIVNQAAQPLVAKDGHTLSDNELEQ